MSAGRCIRSRLNVVLAARRITKRELCERAGLSRSTVYYWSTDRGIAGASLCRLLDAAVALGCGVSDLFEEVTG